MFQEIAFCRLQVLEVPMLKCVSIIIHRNQIVGILVTTACYSEGPKEKTEIAPELTIWMT
jgi:hypothetical protein